jgi:hypothetical protein
VSPAIQDLWPSDLDAPAVLTPVAILRRQASLLGQKTKNFVVANVGSMASGDQFQHNFELVAPALGNYRHTLFDVRHKLDPLYPVEINIYPGPKRTQVSDEAEFYAELGKILSSPDVKKVIQTLISQSTAVA